VAGVGSLAGGAAIACRRRTNKLFAKQCRNMRKQLARYR